MPCIMWDPCKFIDKLIEFEQLKDILIKGMIRNPNEKVRKGIESNLKTLCL